MSEPNDKPAAINSNVVFLTVLIVMLSAIIIYDGLVTQQAVQRIERMQPCQTK